MAKQLFTLKKHGENKGWLLIVLPETHVISDALRLAVETEIGIYPRVVWTQPKNTYYIFSGMVSTKAKREWLAALLAKPGMIIPDPKLVPAKPVAKAKGKVLNVKVAPKAQAKVAAPAPKVKQSARGSGKSVPTALKGGAVKAKK